MTTAYQQFVELRVQQALQRQTHRAPSPDVAFLSQLGREQQARIDARRPQPAQTPAPSRTVASHNNQQRLQAIHQGHRLQAQQQRQLQQQQAQWLQREQEIDEAIATQEQGIQRLLAEETREQLRAEYQERCRQHRLRLSGLG